MGAEVLTIQKIKLLGILEGQVEMPTSEKRNNMQKQP
jgi:hypothetical protein